MATYPRAKKPAIFAKKLGSYRKAKKPVMVQLTSDAWGPRRWDISAAGKGTATAARPRTGAMDSVGPVRPKRRPSTGAMAKTRTYRNGSRPCEPKHASETPEGRLTACPG